jgi:hypothetical protein
LDRRAGRDPHQGEVVLMRSRPNSRSAASAPKSAQASAVSRSPSQAFMPRAALRPAPIASITVAAPVTMSPPANTPAIEVAKFSSVAM